MGLFSDKKHKAQHPTQADAEELALNALNEQFQEELRQLGREHFKELLTESTAGVKKGADDAVRQISYDLRDYMRRQLDATVAHINTDITEQLSDRLKKFDAVAAESREAMVRSLNHDTQTLSEKYQQLSASLQQAVAQQEVMMIGIFQDYQSRLSTAQEEQDAALSALKKGTESARQHSEHLEKELHQSIEQQKTELEKVYKENLARVQATSAAQTETLERLIASADALEKKHQELAHFLDTELAEQKAKISVVINDNMARIVEHYVVGALGEQSDVRTQLPAMLRQLEQHKQDMMDDMKL